MFNEFIEMEADPTTSPRNEVTVAFAVRGSVTRRQQQHLGLRHETSVWIFESSHGQQSVARREAVPAEASLAPSLRCWQSAGAPSLLLVRRSARARDGARRLGSGTVVWTRAERGEARS